MDLFRGAPFYFTGSIENSRFLSSMQQPTPLFGKPARHHDGISKQREHRFFAEQHPRREGRATNVQNLYHSKYPSRRFPYYAPVSFERQRHLAFAKCKAASVHPDVKKSKNIKTCIFLWSSYPQQPSRMIFSACLSVTIAQVLYLVDRTSSILAEDCGQSYLVEEY